VIFHSTMLPFINKTYIYIYIYIFIYISTAMLEWLPEQK
jgi:hypothetical protein